MNENELEQRLARFSARLGEGIPPKDPRETSECLTYNDIAKLIRGTASAALLEKKEHILGCARCTRAIRLAAQQRGLPVQNAGGVSSAMEFASAPPRISLLRETPYLAEIRLRIADWLRGKALPPDAPSSVFFDEAGALHIHREGLEIEGDVRIQIDLEGEWTEIGAGKVQAGILDAILELDLQGIQNIRLPEEIVQVKALW